MLVQFVSIIQSAQRVLNQKCSTVDCQLLMWTYFHTLFIRMSTLKMIKLIHKFSVLPCLLGHFFYYIKIR